MFLSSYADSVGMIAYFDQDCPSGWVKYSDLDGKFVLAESNAAQINQTGGESSVTLTENQNAPHFHALFANS